MKLSRRQFTQAGLGAGALLASGIAPLSAAEHELLERPIPSTGETIPVIGVGTNRYGVGDDAAARAPLKASLARFRELGGTVVDTAPMYRSSETVLGDLVGELGIGDELFMATKVDRKGRSTQVERMQRSFRLLGYETIDLMQCHNIIDWQTAIPVMREWQEAGRVRYIGITTSRENEYAEFERIMREHQLDFVQVNYSLADQRLSAERLLPLAAERGMAVLVNRPFGGGNVFGKLRGVDLPDWARDFDVGSWGQFLLKYVLSHPAVTAAIPGMTKPRHVEDNMGAGRGRLPSAEERRLMERFFDAL